MIAVTFALPSESSDFRRLLGARHHEVVILHTGVGEKICRQRLEPFLDSQPFDFLISSGFAGGVEPSLGAGHLFLAENFSDPDLLARARAALICRVGKLATADRVVENPAEREQFARQQDAAAVDMETDWIFRACAARKIPMLSLRVISDTTAAPFPAPPEVLFDLSRQRTNASALARYLFTHPFAIIRLIRFSRQIATARKELGLALTTLLLTEAEAG
jgi:adenosylhomocysteine nucleosidase